MERKKRGRPTSNDYLSTEFGRTILRFIAGKNCSERTLRNLAYRQNTVAALRLLQQQDDNETFRSAGNYWWNKFESGKPVNSFFVELGKIEDVITIAKLLIESYQLLQEEEQTMGELTELIKIVRRDIALWKQKE